MTDFVAVSSWPLRRVQRLTAALTALKSALLALTAGFVALPATALHAAPSTTHVTAGVPLEQSAAPSTCDTPQHHQLDFWVGDWQVFDASTQKLVAFDHIEKHSEGCIIEEHLTFLTDLYRRPGVRARLEGISISRFDGERWLQMWADNQWGAISLRGAPNAQGQMEFVSVIPSRNRDVKLVYETRPDTSVRILQYVAPAGSGKWVKYGDLIYRSNR